MPATIESITATKGSPADALTIWKQVNVWTWIGMGARASRVIRCEDGIRVAIYLGAGTHKRTLIIKLNGADLYDIEIGRVRRSDFEWIVEAQDRDIYAEDLGRALRDLYDSVKV